MLTLQINPLEVEAEVALERLNLSEEVPRTPEPEEEEQEEVCPTKVAPVTQIRSTHSNLEEHASEAAEEDIDSLMRLVNIEVERL